MCIKQILHKLSVGYTKKLVIVITFGRGSWWQGRHNFSLYIFCTFLFIYLFIKNFILGVSAEVFIYLFLRLYLFIFRQRGKEREREREKHQCVVASCAPFTGVSARNPGMCPDWDSKQHPCGSQAGAQSTEPQKPGQNAKF